MAKEKRNDKSSAREENRYRRGVREHRGNILSRVEADGDEERWTGMRGGKSSEERRWSERGGSCAEEVAGREGEGGGGTGERGREETSEEAHARRGATRALLEPRIERARGDYYT